MASFTPQVTYCRLLRMAFLIVLASEEPCAITYVPFTPSSRAPPYSR